MYLQQHCEGNFLQHYCGGKFLQQYYGGEEVFIIFSFILYSNFFFDKE